ncbi:MAG: hypothetical protein KJ709_02460 [Nanoarchaeota archaeon]|nr:hypothetical protein [Nanoarchaeota archaeon]
MREEIENGPDIYYTSPHMLLVQRYMQYRRQGTYIKPWDYSISGCNELENGGLRILCETPEESERSGWVTVTLNLPSDAKGLQKDLGAASSQGMIGKDVWVYLLSGSESVAISAKEKM